ncbi:TonB family protein [bacterium]|nr:TonB family protein [bacterium]MBU1956812.1 TonB family protein [bacterium]
MRFFIAFFISLFVYLLLIWLYIAHFSKVVVPPKRVNNHVIKIDIRDIPDPKSLPIPKSEPIATVKPVVKKIVEKKPVKKKVPAKKIAIKPKIKPKVTKKNVKKKDDDIVYIPEPFIVKPSKQQVEKSDDLASFLGAAVPSNSSSTTKSYPNKKIQKLYGSTFHTYTPTQKKFIEDNLDEIQRITQNTLTRRGYPQGAGRTGQQGTNVVSFNLHPNGNISELHLKTRIGYRALDDNTLELIKTAYKDYPYPSTTTKIVFYVTYSIYGY